MIIINLFLNNDGVHKYKAIINYPNRKNNFKIVEFGAYGYEDYTMHKDHARMKGYINRHKTREEKYWNIYGIETPSFWSRFLLWSHSSIDQAIDWMERQFKIKIIKNF
jgi:uncharacterized protein YuzB (UPF0349 family)